jgi:hypothetical protein
LNRQFTLAQTVSCRAAIAATHVRFHASECEMCGERNGTVTAFAASLSVLVCQRHMQFEISD